MLRHNTTSHDKTSPQSKHLEQPSFLHQALDVCHNPLGLLVQRQQRLSVRRGRRPANLSPHVEPPSIIFHDNADDFGADRIALFGCDDHWGWFEAEYGALGVGVRVVHDDEGDGVGWEWC